MKPVSQAFLKEQLRTISGGIRWSYMLYADGEFFDLNPYLIVDALSTIDWRTEDEICEFVPPDIQFSVWFDQALWFWLMDHREIRLRVKERFANVPTDDLLTFWGYLDKDNLGRSAVGRIDIRAYGFARHLASIKSSSIFGAPESMLPLPPDAVQAGQMFNRGFTGVIDGVNKVFTTEHDFKTESTRVFLNGVREKLAYSYEETGPNEITFSEAPEPGDFLWIDYELDQE